MVLNKYWASLYGTRPPPTFLLLDFSASLTELSPDRLHEASRLLNSLRPLFDMVKMGKALFIRDSCMQAIIIHYRRQWWHLSFPLSYTIDSQWGALAISFSITWEIGTKYPYPPHCVPNRNHKGPNSLYFKNPIYILHIWLPCLLKFETHPFIS